MRYRMYSLFEKENGKTPFYLKVPYSNDVQLNCKVLVFIRLEYTGHHDEINLPSFLARCSFFWPDSPP